ncbi:MAG TPA: hypothetical protein DGG94_19760 [Micromonosporaceae bacterium]|nr:hypothetical protein [Micromonosporaceae bacterium]HCU52004.1 hypothetical protein [Micromonosporaceae bacterium]
MVDTRKVRELAILLPGDEPDDLDPIDGIPKDKTTVAGRLISGEAWTRVKLTGCTITRCWLVNADLASIDFTEVTFDRCVFRGCSLIGAHLTESALKNVIFENCRLDYATFTTVRTTGPVAILGSSLTETVFDRCKLNALVVDSCKLNAPTFTACDMRGTDLRGNDLSKTIGVTTSLRGSILSEDQVIGFTEAVTRELELTIKEPSTEALKQPEQGENT